MTPVFPHSLCRYVLAIRITESKRNVAEAESSSNINLEVVLGCLRRRRWWVVLTAAAIALLTLVALSFLPKRYTSEATLLVVEQQVPQRYVVPNSTTDISEELEATTHEVLSRTGLLGLIVEFDLYSKDRAHLLPEELEAKMRKQISIEPIIARPDQKTIDAFKISFTCENPRKAQAVTNRLTSLFIEQNLETREHQATVTTGFLKEQLEVAKVKLAEQEARVRDFKLQNLGQLPEQQGGNLAVLAGLQAQLQNIQSSAARAQEQAVYLQSLLNGYRSLADRGLSVAGQGGPKSELKPAGGSEGGPRPVKSQEGSAIERLYCRIPRRNQGERRDRDRRGLSEGAKSRQARCGERRQRSQLFERSASRRRFRWNRGRHFGCTGQKST